jgi:hypothetical protein
MGGESWFGRAMTGQERLRGADSWQPSGVVAMGSGGRGIFSHLRAHFRLSGLPNAICRKDSSAAQGSGLQLRIDLPKQFLIRIPTRE